MVNICLGKDFSYRLQAGQKTHRRPVLKGFVLQTQMPAFNKFMVMSTIKYQSPLYSEIIHVATFVGGAIAY